MDAAKELKEQRTKEKRKVTTAAKKLTSAIERNCDMNYVEKFQYELEMAMTDFKVIQSEYCDLIEGNDEFSELATVNGQNLAEYENGVKQAYDEAIHTFKEYLVAFKKTVKCDPLLKRFDSNRERLLRLCEKTRQLIEGESLFTPQVLEGVNKQIDPLVNELLELRSQLEEFEGLNEIERALHNVNALLTEVDQLKFDCTMALNNTDRLSRTGPYTRTRVDTSPSKLYSANPELRTVTSPEIQIKKTKLPEFSGLRRDWPEFKVVWKTLAEGSLHSKAALAFELKRSLKGEAKERVKNVFVTKAEAYDLIWERLSEFYDDVSAGVSVALEGLKKLKPVREDDYRAIVKLVDEVESAHAQLEELGQVEAISAREIDSICELLPPNTKMLWYRAYHAFDDSEKIKPLNQFMKFLLNERATVARLAEFQKGKKIHATDSNAVDLGKASSKLSFKSCVIHKGDGVKHKTEDCKDFKMLPLERRFQSLRGVHACFRCFGSHRRDSCRSKVRCAVCGKGSHHSLMCKQTGADSVRESSPSLINESVEPQGQVSVVQAASNTVQFPSQSSLYAIQEAFVIESGRTACVFLDNGSTASYITHQAAARLKAKRVDRYVLDITTMGNISREIDTTLYEVSLRTTNGEIVPILVFGIEQITGAVSPLDLNLLGNIFPDRDVSLLQRKSSRIDILLGCDYYRLHPKHEVSTCDNLSIMRGELGVCLIGSHPDLVESTEMNSNMVKVVHESRIKVETNFITQKRFLLPHLHDAPVRPLLKCDVNLHDKKLGNEIFRFVAGEEMGVASNPKCGGCKCGKCPLVGHTYSFREEQELRMIQDNLRYDELDKCWYTGYPWIRDPAQLPDNYHIALATLRSTEKRLNADTEWALKYEEQIEDMLCRGVARKLTPEEMHQWKGPYFYISHMAVSCPRSQSTPIRIVFNSSQNCKGVSLNSCLAKGPDNYMNDLLGLLLRWREEKVAVVGDIRKMFHSVRLEEAEQHCHRFLWRDLDCSREPDVYIMLRVNMGDTPAPAICTEALQKTAEKFGSQCPRAALMLTKSTYVDDLVDSFADKSTAESTMKGVENVLQQGGFQIKCWLTSGDSATDSLLKTSGEVTRVLGIVWNSELDIIVFEPVLNFSAKRSGQRMGPNLKELDLKHALPTVLTRRIVLQQVMSIFDPLGLLSPFTFIAKLRLRQTWQEGLGWDDPLPPKLYEKWVEFFESLFQLENIRFNRCLKPDGARGDPWLIIMSDASDLAYGFAAYIRWEIGDGEDSHFWCRLIMAKCRIAPLRKLSTPQMELNAAVLSCRGRQVIEREMRFKFSKVLQLVDSETVLCMLNKTSTKFKVYEGVRIGEIQAATRGNMSEWAWLSGKQNTADWLTRGKLPQEITASSEWWQGPSFLYDELEKWQLKFGPQMTNVNLPGEKKLVLVSTVLTDVKPSLGIDYSRFGSGRSIFWVVARLLSICRGKSFKAGNLCNVTADLLREAEVLVLKDVQRTFVEVGCLRRFKSLVPVLNSSGLTVVGKRCYQSNPMTPEGDAQVLLPTKHPVTRLLMRDAHTQGGHRGRDATLARFRARYWTPHGAKVAWSIKNSCQMCKLREPQFVQQQMGPLPEQRSKPMPPFTNVMIDLFGPYKVKGEVQKRISGKAYGVLFTDMTMRAVHIEGVFGYDVDSFLLAFGRFVNVRGWPEKVFSDPGSQLVCVSKELLEAWKKIHGPRLSKISAENGLTWIFGPADAPWHQGAAEALIKSIKRAFTFAFHGVRFSPSEFLSVCYEVANNLNERPIGTLPCEDAELSLLTPNSLLLGRATAKNPGGWHPQSHLHEKFHLVQQISNQFWQKWCEICAPALIIQKKWHTACRNLREGDIVLMADKNSFRGQYKIAVVKKVFPGSDGRVRRVALAYKNFKVGEKVQLYSGASDIEVTRSVHKLALLVPAHKSE